MESQLVKQDEDCEKMKEEIFFLNKEVDKLNKNLKSSQALDDILSHQISPPKKYGFGYASKSSKKSDAKP